MKARELRFHMITAADAAALDAAVLAWLNDRVEEDIIFQESGVDGATFWATIWYSE